MDSRDEIDELVDAQLAKAEPDVYRCDDCGTSWTMPGSLHCPDCDAATGVTR